MKDKLAFSIFFILLEILESTISIWEITERDFCVCYSFGRVSLR